MLLAAVLVMYIVLGVLYESFIHPVTILSHVAVGRHRRFARLMLAGDDLTIIALIGIILLIGIREEKRDPHDRLCHPMPSAPQGLSPREAIYQACLLRFRPILMTTVAAIFGALPLMFGTGTARSFAIPWVSASSAGSWSARFSRCSRLR